MSMNLPKTINTSYTPSGNFQVHVPSNYSKPPRQSISPSNIISNKPSESYKNLYSPRAEKIITEQNKILAQLQAQILELQAHVFNSTPKNKKQTSVASFSSSFTPNRISNYTNTLENQLNNAETSCKELFQETPRLKKSASNGTDLIHSLKNYQQELEINKKPNNQEINTEKILDNVNAKKNIKNSSEKTNTIKNSSQLNVKNALENEEKRITYNPLRYSTTSPEPSPQPYQSKPKAQNESDNTIYVPKIQYDTGSESSGEDEQIEAVERKYLCQS